MLTFILGHLKAYFILSTKLSQKRGSASYPGEFRKVNLGHVTHTSNCGWGHEAVWLGLVTEQRSQCSWFLDRNLVCSRWLEKV